MLRIFLSVFLCLFFLVGCATKKVIITPEMAVIETSGPIKSVDSNKTPLLSAMRSMVVAPGMRVVEVFGGCQGQNCWSKTYRFNVEEGRTYRLFSDQITVIDRKTNDRVELLTKESNSDNYIDKNARVKKLNSIVFSELQLLEKRQKNLSYVRKVGARICQNRGGYVYIGFVESIAKNKIQIRVSEAMMENHPNIHPGGFKPEIIWDQPIKWDLCE